MWEMAQLNICYLLLYMNRGEKKQQDDYLCHNSGNQLETPNRQAKIEMAPPLSPCVIAVILPIMPANSTERLL